MSDGRVVEMRQRLLRVLFPRGVPTLWCPALTHYDRDGAIDAGRIVAHLRHLSSHVKGFLIPGSTGDGWDLSASETRQVLQIALEQAPRLDFCVLAGVLQARGEDTLKAIRELVDWLALPATDAHMETELARARICGVAICAPRGSEVSQQQMESAFRAALETGLPAALYQLPQVTQNEFGPELAAKLAGEFGNLILFKDSSGGDRVILSGKGLQGVFAMRGGEGDYARWLKIAGGPYDGFLLSTANCFAAELTGMVQDLSAGNFDAAHQMSERLTAVVNEVFRLAASVPKGNFFTNANKAMDHFFAHGPHALKAVAPTLHGGGQLPLEMLRATAETLARYQLMPAKGYLE